MLSWIAKRWWVLIAVFIETLSFRSSIGVLRRNSNMYHELAKRLMSMDRSNSRSTRKSITQRERNEALSRPNDVSTSNLDEAQVLLACRAYLIRKHKVEWEGKKVRAEAAASPLFNEGYFWCDPSDLLYLRKNPDPFNLIDNETESKIVMSTNPFSTNPLYPSEEHRRRSNARANLWSNQTWKELWYEKRWKGRKVTEEVRKQKLTKRRIENLPLDLLESPKFLALSEEEVAAAIISYVRAKKRMSEAKKKLKKKRLTEREQFLQWKNALKREAEGIALQMKVSNSTRRDVGQKSIPLSFEPSPDVMKSLKDKRSQKSKRAYEKRSQKSMFNATCPPGHEMTKFRHTFSRDENGSDESIQAILRINNALDSNQIPSIADVETILKPGRLGRRKAILLRILSECYGLKGKCIPGLRNGRVLISGSSEEDMIIGQQISARLAKRVGWPIFVSCSFHGWGGDSGSGEAFCLGLMFRRSWLRLWEKEVARILIREKERMSDRAR
ncbi:hypothetical protein HJC23_001285 [Cyclotella cryptica]|uniref:Uncharacterized protein n=1 Tax=Cyclotella cryptica TaxID=29204 RepID=A0ABD3PAM1_9STRA